MISGFVILLSLENTKNVKQFIIKRFFRLYPTYWLALIITFIFVQSFGLSGREISFKEFLLNFLMFHGVFNIKDVDGVYWSLLYELKFYLLVAIFLYFNKLNDIVKFLNAVLLLNIIFISLHLNDFLFYKIFKKILFLDYLMYFAAGIGFYKMYKQEIKFETILLIILSFANALLYNNFHNLFMVFVLFIIFLLLLTNFKKIFRIKILIFLGEISYALYLLHQNIGYVLLNKMVFVDNLLVRILITICIVVFLAYLITYYFEKPLLRYIKKI
jgi:peptidoglycan/LPS O-acetylase OafA/YrhL